MTYDMHGSWEPFTGHNAPLYPRADENADQKTLNIDSVVKYWISNGASPSKLAIIEFKIINLINTNWDSD